MAKEEEKKRKMNIMFTAGCDTRCYSVFVLFIYLFIFFLFTSDRTAKGGREGGGGGGGGAIRSLI